MMTNLRADVETIQWVVTSFMVTRTVVMPTIGWVSAVAGSRTFYLVGLLVYIVGSVLCGLSWSVPSLVFFRVIQALGAGPLFPLSMGMLYKVFPAHQRGLAMGIFMAGISVGPAIGPSIGGYLVEHLNWRMIFYMNLPMGIISLAAVALILPKSARPRYFLGVNRNKRGIVLDLKQEAAREIVYKLTHTADVVVENFRPGVVDRLQIGYAQLSAINPRLVYCSLSGSGESNLTERPVISPVSFPAGRQHGVKPLLRYA